MKNIGIGLVVVAGIVGGIWLYQSDSGQPVETATPMASKAQTVLPTMTPIVSPTVAPTKTVTPTPTATATPTPTKTPTPSSGPVTFTAAQVATNNSRTSCHSIIRGSVYDLTTYIDKHPAGPQKILDICGKDGSSLFVEQHGGSAKQENMLATLKIGVLAQ